MVKRQYNCKVCGGVGHNSRTCPNKTENLTLKTNKKDLIVKVVNTKLQSKVDYITSILEASQNRV